MNDAVAAAWGRIDAACHRANAGTWRFYERIGVPPLGDERILMLV